jgi:uncharacterized protein
MSNAEKIEQLNQRMVQGCSAAEFAAACNDLALDEVGTRGRTLLMMAASQGLFEAVEALLQRGASLNATGYLGKTPLHEAATCGRTDMVRHLLSRGAEIDARAEADSTPLMCAAAFGEVEVVRLLLECGASPALQDRRGFTAAEGAREKGEDEAADLIDSHASRLTMPDS